MTNFGEMVAKLLEKLAFDGSFGCVGPRVLEKWQVASETVCTGLPIAYNDCVAYSRAPRNVSIF